MKLIAHLSPVLCLCWIPLQTMAQAEESVGALTEMSANNARPLMKLLNNASNDLLKNKRPFLSLRHIENENSSLEDGYALDYNWSRSFDNATTRVKISGSETNIKTLSTASYNLELFAKGSYAWADASNNEDLSKFGITAKYMKSSSAWNDLGQSSTWYRDCVTVTEPGENGDDAVANCWLEFITPNDTLGAFAYEFGFNYHTEGNQDLSEKQDAYGASFALSYEPARNSTLQRLNLLDYPFRWLRNFSDLPYFNPSLPTISLALEQVDPDGNTRRTQLMNAGATYDRAHFVAAFSTRAGAINGYPITFEWIYQAYAEVDAPASVKAANLDEFEHSKISLYIPMPFSGIDLGSEEIFVSYTSGTLPFDLIGEAAVSIGWQSNLSDLFGL